MKAVENAMKCRKCDLVKISLGERRGILRLHGFLVIVTLKLTSNGLALLLKCTSKAFILGLLTADTNVASSTYKVGNTDEIGRNFLRAPLSAFSVTFGTLHYGKL